MYARIDLGGGVKQKFIKIKKEIFSAIVEGRFKECDDE